MKNKLQFAVVIPTYNRVENLRECISHFDKQIVPDHVELSLVISNTASTDDTPKLLNELKRDRKNFYVTNTLLDCLDGQYGGVLKAIPNKIDWVWLMGDDDQFSDVNSIKKISQIIFDNITNENFAFIHACDANRSTSSGRLFHDTTLNLCKSFGYLEMLGWFTSLVVKKTSFVEAYENCEERRKLSSHLKLSQTPYSAFMHSGYFFQSLYQKDAVFIDEPLVCEQLSSDKNKTEERWRDANTGERYVFIADDFERLIKNNAPLTELPSQFFKYHKYHLWDRLMSYQIDAALEVAKHNELAFIESYLPKFIHNWQRIEFLAKMLSKTETQKWLILTARSIKAQCILLFKKPHDTDIAASLSETRQLLTLGCYDYHINFSKTKIFRP